MRMLALVIFASLAALFHLLFFILESLLWEKPAARRIFHTSPEEARTTKFLAFNQGFYNLFLSMGVITGLGLNYSGHAIIGMTLVAFACACMVGAALVLATGGKSRWRGALIQGIPPLLALISIGMGL